MLTEDTLETQAGATFAVLFISLFCLHNPGTRRKSDRGILIRPSSFAAIHVQLDVLQKAGVR